MEQTHAHPLDREGKPINTGVVPQPLRPDAWIAGEESGIVFQSLVKDGQWRLWKPTGEKQFDPFFDTMACVSFTVNQAIAVQLNRMKALGLLPQEMLTDLADWMDETGSFNFSDRLTAWGSGTDAKNGNWAPDVADWVKKNGLVPEKDWAFSPNMTREEYYATPPQAVLDKAKRILKWMDLPYEWIYANASANAPADLIKLHLQQAPLCLASSTCAPWGEGVIPACPFFSPNHETLITGFEDGIVWWDFDHYEPFEKQLAWDYFLPYLFKQVVILKPIVKPVPVTPLNIVQVPSKNFGSRGAYKPEAIVLHISTGSIGEESIGSLDNTFSNPASNVSAHYGVAKNGAIHQYVDEKNAAWHAGVVNKPIWRLIKPAQFPALYPPNPNLYTIGIEHEGKETDVWTPEQIKSSAALVADIAKRWNIPLDRDHVIGHYEIDQIRRPNCPAVDKSIVDKILKIAKGGTQFTYTFKVTLHYGAAASPEVRKLQQALQFLGYMKAGVFGKYGDQTRLALAQLQKDHGIDDDGTNFGPQTRALVNKLLA